MVVNDNIADRQISHMHWVERYKTQVSNDLLIALFSMDDSLSKMIKLSAASLYTDSPSMSVIKRRQKFLEKVLLSEQEGAKKYTAVLNDELKGFGGYEAGFQSRLLDEELPDAITAVYDTRTPTTSQVWSYATERPLIVENVGATSLKTFTKSISDSRLAIIDAGIRQGFVLGMSQNEIVDMVIGTRANNFRDGLIQKSRNWAQAVVRTSLNHLATSARVQTYQDNSDIVKGYQILATLDTRTTPICQSLDMKVWYPGDKKNSTLPREMYPPFHVGCRTTTTPVTKSFRELGIDIDEISSGERVSMDGAVSDKLSYPQWLKKQSAERQREVLGASRYKAWKEGKVSIEKFADIKDMRTLTLDELGIKDARKK